MINEKFYRKLLQILCGVFVKHNYKYYDRLFKRDKSDEVVRRLNRINLLVQRVNELRVEIDNIFAMRDNFANYLRDGFDANRRIGAERVTWYLRRLREQQIDAEARVEELEAEIEALRRECEDL